MTPSDMASGDPAPRSSVTAGAVTVRVPSEFQTRTADQWPRIGGFLEDHWLAPDGAIEPAPWASESFRRELESKLDRAIRGVDLQTAWVLATALERLAIPAVLSSHTIEEISDLLFDRRIPGPDIPRAEKLARLAQADDGSAEARAVVFLESLVGAAPLFPTDSTATRVGYSTQFLKEVVEFALQCRKLGLDPAERLAATTQPAQEMSREQLESKLRETQEELKELVRKNFSAAGGRIQRSHCRKAWTKFMERVTDPLRQAYERPTAQSISALRDLPEKIMQIHREEADRAKARFGDRNSMDRTAAEVSRGVRAVVRALDQLTAAHPDRRPDTPAPPPGLSALAEMPLADPYEDLLRRCVLAVLHPAANAQGQPARLSVRDLRRRPLFLPLAATWIQQGVADDDEVPLSELSAPAVLTTAASLLAQEHRGPALMGLDRLAPHLRRLAMPLLDEAGRDATRRAEGDLRQRIEDFIETLGENAQRLDQLASQGASTVRQLCVEARAALEPRTEREPMLVARWLEQTIGLAAEHLAELENHPATSALRGPAHSNRELRLRETPWRDEGLARWPNAAFALRTLTETKSGVENPHEAKIIAELFGRWSDGILTTAQSNRVLLNRFGGYAFGGVNNFYQEGSGNFAVTVSAQDIRERLRVLERNPSFLPQLAQQFARAVLVAPPEKVTSLRFAVKTADLVSEYPGDLVFVLAPAINAANRRASIMELQQRKLLAAVIDDVDLLRLFNPGAPAPDPLVGAMELALEQQSLDRVNPFDLHDGQSVKMEMFVGRRDEARDLSMTPRYSRLFSGRKLGKSALLRFIQTEKTAQFLPSGNRLSVHYVPIVGAESEQAVVADILGSLEETHGAQPPREGLAAPEKLKATLQAFAQSKPTESLLFVLDESDSFVEEQVAQYDKHREKILAFKMRELESIRDSRGHPRFRFVFAGYRTTSTSEGAWANWGETLILKPLEREDAVRLIAGPLARIGIDASAHADIIAHRCAEQPAVLLRFGQRLLALLAAQRRTDPGKRLPVTRELVSTVFEDMSMQEEIRTVVQNNFQGNDTGRAIFFSALNEFARVVPGAPVSQLDEKIATSLGAMDRDGRWMESGATPETVVRGALRELVHRQLMVEFDNDGVLSWSLKYPHMLPALLQGSPDEQIRRALASSAAGPSSTRTKSFLGRAEIEEMASFLRSVPPEPVAFLVASSWEEPLANSRFGLPDRLGVTPIDASGLARNVLAGRASSVPAVFCGVSADAARILVSSRPRTLPALVLIGGPDLIRWACKVGSSVDGFLLELASPGRVDRARLDWWFRRARGIEFLDASRCLDTIADMTRGVPYLLKIMDSCLLEKPGADGGITLSDHDFDVALRAYEQRVSNLGAQGAGLDLDRRDAELVAIIASASNQLGTDLAKGLLDKELRCDFEPRFAPMDPAVDAERIGRLVALGLLPAKRGAGSALERLEPISEGDPVLRLAGFP
ncbi:MAG: hypothetical protein HYV07_06950 [Deltaproteobacteria bacterium]|nr:hypothetical protein [Deltaproteobacteria bacterium]